MAKPSNAVVALLISIKGQRDALRRNGDTWFIEGGGCVKARTAESALDQGLIEKTKEWPGVHRFGCFSVSQPGLKALARVATARERE